MWKILSGITALLLLLSAVFAYMNYNALRVERQRVKDATQRLNVANDRQSAADVALSNAKTELDDLTTQRGEAETALADTNTQVDERNAALEEKAAERKSVEDELLAIKTELEKVGDIREIQEKIAQLQTELQEAKEEYARLKNVEALALEEERTTKSEIETAQTLVNNQNSGKMPSVNTSIRNVYGQWGFVVIGAGNRQGVVRDATLNILRGGDVIAKAKVSKVEPYQAVANIIRDSLAPGVIVQPGDRVVVDSTSATSG